MNRSDSPCFALKNGVAQEEQKSLLTVNSYEVAFHAWDRLQVPTTIKDPFANRSFGGEVVVVPYVVAQAFKSRKKVVRFFCRHL